MEGSQLVSGLPYEYKFWAHSKQEQMQEHEYPWYREGENVDMFPESCWKAHPQRSMDRSWKKRTREIMSFKHCVNAAKAITRQHMQIRVDPWGEKNTYQWLQSLYKTKPQGCTLLPKSYWSDPNIPELVFSISGSKDLEFGEMAVCWKPCEQSWGNVRSGCKDWGSAVGNDEMAEETVGFEENDKLTYFTLDNPMMSFFAIIGGLSLVSYVMNIVHQKYSSQYIQFGDKEIEEC